MEIKKVFLLGIVGMLWFSSCKKGEKNVLTPVYDESSTPVDSILKKDFFFQPGTYWVYTIDSSSLQDCTYVLSSRIINKAVYDLPSTSPGGVSVARYIYNTAEINLSGTTEPTKYYLTKKTLLFNNFTGRDANPLFDLTEGKFIADSLQYYSTLTVGSVSYNDVYRIEFFLRKNAFNYCPIKDSSYFYLNESIGIVRKDLYQGNGVYKRYYLKRYHIVK